MGTAPSLSKHEGPQPESEEALRKSVVVPPREPLCPLWFKVFVRIC
jgi:hypothetical protein